MEKSLETRSVWKDAERKTFWLYPNRDESERIELKKDDVITFEGREEGVKIVQVYGDSEDEGPIGFTYLPWREKEQRWASPAMSHRGDPRFIICYPSGLPHYGQHVRLDTIRK
jgi:hypothetical protein